MASDRNSERTQDAVNSSRGQNGSNWTPGGKYEVSLRTPVWQKPDRKSTRVTELKPKDIILLLTVKHHHHHGILWGLIVPPLPARPGWAALEDSKHRTTPFLRERLEGSWELRAQYRVRHPATLREGPLLSSPECGQLEPGDEVLVIGLGVSADLDDDITPIAPGEARLRARVATESGLIAWLSPETASGELLLDDVNLLSIKVVDEHRKAVQAGAMTGIRSSKVQKKGDAPWEVGHHYRALVDQTLREQMRPDSAMVGKVDAATVVDVLEIQTITLPDWGCGFCVCMFVSIVEGESKGLMGWLNCEAEDGTDMIDHRDLLSFEKILEKLKEEDAIEDAESEPSDNEDDGMDEDAEVKKESVVLGRWSREQGLADFIKDNAIKEQSRAKDERIDEDPNLNGGGAIAGGGGGGGGGLCFTCSCTGPRPPPDVRAQPPAAMAKSR